MMLSTGAMISFWRRQHYIPACISTSLSQTAPKTLCGVRSQHKQVVISSCVDTHCFCLLLSCTGLHLHKAAPYAPLGAIFEALESRIVKLTKSQDNFLVSALLGKCSMATVLGNLKRAGPAEPGLIYRTPLCWQTPCLWLWPNTTTSGRCTVINS